MNTFTTLVKNFIADEQGATAIEYGLLAALIAVVIITSVSVIGQDLNTIFKKIATCLVTPADATCK